ncbi:hypothetical protein EAF00_007276 [Botryotinia globosa]|nr:hypothetical protein EAF00_007276 [Botryotinia globosa]
MSVSTETRPSSPQSTKSSNQSTNSKLPKSTHRILRDAGFRGMIDFMYSYELKLHNDEDLEQAKEMIERMKEEDLRNSKFGGDSDEENVENERGVKSSEEENGAVELSGFLDVVSCDEEVSDEQVSDEEVSDEEVEDVVVESIGFVDVVSCDEEVSDEQVSDEEVSDEEVEDVVVESIGEEESDESVGFDGGMVDDDNVGEAFGYEDSGGRDDDSHGDVYDDQDDQDDFEDDFEDDHSYDDLFHNQGGEGY